jgi:hypothetical protein
MSTEPILPISQCPVNRPERRRYRQEPFPLRNGEHTGDAASAKEDGTDFSPLAELVGTLEALRESNPPKYALVTRQLAANLMDAARLAQAQGDSDAEKQLMQLAADFSGASENGQLRSLLRSLSHPTDGRGAGDREAKLHELFSTPEDHSAQNAALDDAVALVRTVSG